MRILFVAISDSIHTARWLSQLTDQNWDLHLFPSDWGTYPHKDYRKLTIHSFFRGLGKGYDRGVDRKGIPWPSGRLTGRFKKFCERLAPNRATEAARLARTIQKLNPDVIHIMEMQSAGYLALEGLKRLEGRGLPPCIFSTWGSDLFLFGRQPEHEKRTRDLLARCDYLITDCERDIPLAREFGFQGETLGVFTTAGGYDLAKMRLFRQPGPTSTRRVIALKGYEGIRGARALKAIEALRLCGDLLSGFELVVYLTSDETKNALTTLGGIQGFRVTVLPYSPHEEVLKLMGSARIAIGVGTSDGTPNAMLEAMVLGALPIQSDTVSTAEWIRDGENGLLVSPEDPQSIARAIRRGLTDDDLVDRAANLNTRIADERLDMAVIQPQVIELYKRVAGQTVPNRQSVSTVTFGA
jgi:glycosyltransferase involved in cell wall biosynthesis